MLTILLAKFSVGFLLLRLIGRTSRVKVWFFHITLAVYTLATLFCIVMGIVSATVGGFPQTKYSAEAEESNIFYEEEFLLPYYCDHQAAPEIIVLATWCILGTFLDFAYSIIGIHTISGTRMTGRRRVGLCLLFGLGFIAGGVAIGRAVVTLCQVRYAWSTLLYDNRYWAFLEGPIVMACGNLCTLVPLWECLRHGKLLRSSKLSPPVPQQREKAARTPQHSYLGWFSAMWPSLMVVESEDAGLTSTTSFDS